MIHFDENMSPDIEVEGDRFDEEMPRFGFEGETFLTESEAINRALELNPQLLDDDMPDFIDQNIEALD